MNKLQENLAAKRHKLKLLEDLRKALKTGKEMRGELKKFFEESGAPKTVEAC